MQSLRRSARILQTLGGSKCFNSSEPVSLGSRCFISPMVNESSVSKENWSYLTGIWNNASLALLNEKCKPNLLRVATVLPPFSKRCMTTSGHSVEAPSKDSLGTVEPPPRIKFKRLDKTAKHIMQILDKEAVEEVKTQREMPDIKPGYIVQLKVEVPENKRRVSILKGIVIARRNAGLNTTFRLRRLVAGVGVESLFPLYSPNIKEIKVLDKKKVRRAKLYYLREKMNPLKKH